MGAPCPNPTCRAAKDPEAYKAEGSLARLALCPVCMLRRVRELMGLAPK